MDAAEAVAEPGEPLTGERERLLVTVDADDGRLGAALEEGLGMPAHAEGPVDEHRSRRGQGRGEEVDDAVAEYGHVPLVGGSP